MTYRILHPSEWDRLKPLFEKWGYPVPPLAASSAAVAEDDDGKIQGVLILQLVLHMEPIIIEKPTVNFRRLQETLVRALEPAKGLTYYCFSESEKVDRMAELGGGELTGYRVWKSEVN